MPRDFVKNDSRKPRKPDNFDKLLKLCKKVSSKNNELVIDFIQFADHFNNVKSFIGSTVNYLDERKRTMLHYAASKGATHIVQCLLENGAETEYIDKYGFNPYGLAMREDKFETAYMLLTSP
jgi:ankyrin repeat protein